MKDNVEEFLLAYKEFEALCRSKGKQVIEIEEELGENNPKMQQIRICRQLRNFCVHNDYTNFIQIHKGMIKFLKDEVKMSSKKAKSVKPKKTSSRKPSNKNVKSIKSFKSNPVKGKSIFKNKKRR